MPMPSVLPSPPAARARLEPLLAQEASYLAASARTRSFCWISTLSLDDPRSRTVLSDCVLGLLHDADGLAGGAKAFKQAPVRHLHRGG